MICSTRHGLKHSKTISSDPDADMGIGAPGRPVKSIGENVEVRTPVNEICTQRDYSSVEPGLTQRVTHGGLWALANQGTRLATALLVTPYVIRKLGSEDYGLLALVNVLIAYMSYSDLGMGLASTKFGTEALAGRGEKSEAAAVWTSVLVTLVPMCLGTGALFLAAKPLAVQLFRLPAHLEAPGIQALRLGVVTAWAVVLGSILNTPQLTRLKLRTNSTIEICVGLLLSCATVAVLAFGGSVTAVVAAGAGAALAGVLIHFSASARLCPSLLRPRHDPLLIRPLLRFGFAIVAGVAIGALIGQAEKFLLVRWGSTRDLAYYSIALTISGLLVIPPTALAQPLMPSFVHLLSSSQKGRLERLYNHMVVGVMVTILPIALLICVGAQPFLTIWAGPEFGRESVLPVYILLAGVVVKAASQVPNALLVALGRVDLLPKFQAAELLPYGLAMLLLVARFGIVGAAIAWSIRTVAESLLVFIAAGRLAGIRQRLLPARPFECCLALVVLIVPVSAAWALLHARSLVLVVALLAVIGYGFIVYLRIATVEERTWFAGWIRGLWS